MTTIVQDGEEGTLFYSPACACDGSGGGRIRMLLLLPLALGQLYVDPGGGISAIEEGVVSELDAEARANADWAANKSFTILY